jgi:hypothetical protein
VVDEGVYAARMEGRCVANERRDNANEMEVMGEGNPMQTRACGEEGRWGVCLDGERTECRCVGVERKNEGGWIGHKG